MDTYETSKNFNHSAEISQYVADGWRVVSKTDRALQIAKSINGKMHTRFFNSDGSVTSLVRGW